MKIVVFEPNGQASDLPPNAVLRSRFKVGRYFCTMTIDCGAYVPGQTSAGMMRAEWEPQLPTKLNKRAIAEYRTGRDALYATAANVIGGRVLLAEL